MSSSAPASSTPFLDGLLSLFAADTETAMIPAALSALQALPASKTALERLAVLNQLQSAALAGAAGIGPELVAQIAPKFSAALQAVLAKAEADVASLAPTVMPQEPLPTAD